MEIKNVIFDFGGVLIDWNPRYLYREMFQDEEEMEFFLAKICNPAWNVQQDAGRSFSVATEVLVAEYPQYEKEIRHYYDNWEKMIKGAIEENVAFLEDLKNAYRLFGLTNWSEESFTVVFNQYPFFKEFEGIVVSGTEKIVKPDARIYELLLTRYDLKAGESLFIDDNKENIDAADKIGFKTIHLIEEVSLKHEFKKLAL